MNAMAEPVEDSIVCKLPESENEVVRTLPYDMNDLSILQEMAALRRAYPGIRFEMHLEPLPVAA